MANNFSSRQNDLEHQKLWDKMQTLLKSRNTNPRAIPYMIGWAKSFVKSLNEKPLKNADLNDVVNFTQQLNCNTSLLPFQVTQAKESLFVLFIEILKYPWAAPWFPELAQNKKLVTKREADETSSKRTDTTNVEQAKLMHTGLFADMQKAIRTMHYSIRTEKTYTDWVRRFLAFHHPIESSHIKATHITEYLEFLATRRNVSASTQNQAMNALVFLATHILGKDFSNQLQYSRAKKTHRLPTVLTKEQVKNLISKLKGIYNLMGGLV